MKAGRVWLLAVGVAGGLALTAVLIGSRGNGPESAAGPHSPPRQGTTPSYEPAVTSVAPAIPRTTSPAGNPAPVATGAGKLSAVADGPPATPPVLPDSPVQWERIPLDTSFGETLGDLATRRAFSLAMRTPPALGACTEGWQAPPGVKQIDMKTELRVRSKQGALVVEDAVLRESNFSDTELERCVLASLRGRRVDAPGMQPGQSFRLAWGSLKYLR